MSSRRSTGSGSGCTPLFLQPLTCGRERCFLQPQVLVCWLSNGTQANRNAVLLSLVFNLFNTNGGERKFIVCNAERILLNKEESKIKLIRYSVLNLILMVFKIMSLL